MPGCSGTRFRGDQVRQVQLYRRLAFCWKFDSPIEKAGPHVPRPALEARVMREVGVHPLVDLDLQLGIKFVQQFFLAGEVGEERALGNTRAPGDLRGGRAESGLGDLVHRRLQDCAAFLRTSDSCHANHESTAVWGWELWRYCICNCRMRKRPAWLYFITKIRK